LAIIAMTLEGDVVVRLAWNGHHVERTDVRVRRPAAVVSLLARQPADVVLATVPLLFSLCRHAQRAAAARALAAAGAVDATDDARAVLLEAAGEHVWRLLMDAPSALGHAPDTAAVAAARRGLAQMTAIASTHVFGMPAAAWLAQSDVDAWAARGATLPARIVNALLREWRDFGSSDVPLMPDATRDAMGDVARHLAAPAFAEAPTWNGMAVETGPLARMRAHPLVAPLLARDGNTVATRMVARLAELAVLLGRLTGDEDSSWVHGFPLAPCEGLGVVQTARGLLLHRARVDGDRTVDYQIVAPTAWNFHPEGPLARALDGLAAADAASVERCARLAVHALDPCVPFRIEVGHA
jgi:hypothetical protein